MATPLAVSTTFLLGAVFFAATAHVAVSYFRGGEPPRKALVVGLALAAVATGMRFAPLPTAAVAAAMLASDAFALAAVYDLDMRGTALATAGHVVVAVVLGFALRNLAVLLL